MHNVRYIVNEKNVHSTQVILNNGEYIWLDEYKGDWKDTKGIIQSMVVPQKAYNDAMRDTLIYGTSIWDYFKVWGKAIPETNTKEPSFTKHDTGKTEYHHLPWDVIEDVAEVLTAGEKKYPGENWKKCTDKNRYLNAVDRHLMDWRLDEREDTESGYSHLVHAICNLLFLCKLEKEGKI